ncbi:unnamed protein product [Schistosoma margrebowiei]|uniref:Uncharacterized protein n=1 Tax=Schistosoma margrebowiei TaxID=48269 RepID=A0A183MVA9_9TREM|nr:unnamed protein product [Schistosoma margrebowiei]
MKTSTSDGEHGTKWTAQNQLDNLDLADDLALLSHTQQMKIKTANVAAVYAPRSLNIHKGKTKVLKYNMENINPITLDGETLEEVESFIDEQGSSDASVKHCFLFSHAEKSYEGTSFTMTSSMYPPTTLLVSPVKIYGNITSSTIKFKVGLP